MSGDGEGEGTGGRLPRGRSPSYPGIALPTAIARAQDLYEHAQQHPMPLAAITGRWGYKAPTTGPASVTYAALKKYGLLEDEGSGAERIGRLTDLAVEILHPNPNREEAIRRAALMPPIHREWWDKYGADLPPVDSLHWEYVVKGRFTDSGLKEFMRVFRETVAFANLGATGPSGESESRANDPAEVGTGEDFLDSPEELQRELDRRLDERPVSSVMSYAIPVAAGVDVVVQGRFPLTEVEWAQFLTVLNAMKPALTRLTDDGPGGCGTSQGIE
jgi:hypothetical protein